MAKRSSTPPPQGEKILIKSMDDMMHESIMPYAEHVILERALPRVEDGLKPVQRRILYTMLELGLTPDKPHRKSARIVGDALGKYHPHGDSSVYEAMVRMAQDFNMRAPLVDGHGNFGSIDGDGAAAMRYTEARMTALAMELLRELDKDTVPFALNFDDTLKEPEILPGRFPNLLVNGASGIAVGLATNIPPHNLGEAIDAALLVLDDPDVSLDAIMEKMPCPDFPTGAYLLNESEIRECYETGRGKLVLRAKTHFEEQKNGKTLIVIDEFPYQVNKAAALEKILALSQEKKTLFAGISDIRDESDRTGIRAVIELRRDTDAQKTLQYLLKYSDLQTTFGVNMVAIADGKPRQMGVREILRHYLQHQRNVVTRRTRFDLENAKKREHILAGLMIAIANIDEVIALIRASKTPLIAREGLMKRFQLTQIQAQAILDLRLQRLTNLELDAIRREYEEILKLIEELSGILASDKKLTAVIRKELLEIRKRHADPRRTQLISGQTRIVVDERDLKASDDATVIVLEGLKIRRLSTRLYQREQYEAEHPLFTLHTRTDRRLLLFTNLGQSLSIAVDELPETRPNQKSANLASLFPFADGERIIAAFSPEEMADGGAASNTESGNSDDRGAKKEGSIVSDDESGEMSESGKVAANEPTYLFVTADGMIKRTRCREYQTRTKRLNAITLHEGDEVLSVEPVTEESVLILTRKAMSIRFLLDSVPVTGRVSGGVKAIRLDGGDKVFRAVQTNDEGEILVISERGYAKRSFVFDHELQGRNGKGVKAFEFRKNGANGSRLAAAFHVKQPFDFVIVQVKGARTTVNTDDVRIMPRAATGVPIVVALFDDEVCDVLRVE